MSAYVQHLREMLRISRDPSETAIRRPMGAAWIVIAFVCPCLAILEMAFMFDKRVAIGLLLGLYAGWVVCQYFINRFPNERAIVFANVVQAGDPDQGGPLIDFFAVLFAVPALGFLVLIPILR